MFGGFPKIISSTECIESLVLHLTSQPVLGMYVCMYDISMYDGWIVYVCPTVCMARMWRPADNFWEFILFCYHMGSGDQTHFINLGSKCPYLLSPLASSHLLVLMCVSIETNKKKRCNSVLLQRLQVT